jgi:hypothetical protein
MTYFLLTFRINVFGSRNSDTHEKMTNNYHRGSRV